MSINEDKEFIFVVQELLGNSTLSVVLDTYSHEIPGLKEKATAKIEDILAKKKPSSKKEGQIVL